MACPTYAYIAKNNNDPSCDQSTIGATTGTTNLEAEWDPNTINMEWYSDGSKITPVNNAANTCIYDGNVTLPTNTLSKTGYTFLGWRVRVAAAPAQCDLSGLNANTTTIEDSEHYRWKPMVEGGWAMPVDNSSDLNDGEWALTFDYGTVKGSSRCSSTPGNTYAQIGTPTDAEGQYCWCKLTSYTPNTGNACNAGGESWVYSDPYGDSGSCTYNCGGTCASSVFYSNVFRAALYGQSN